MSGARVPESARARTLLACLAGALVTALILATPYVTFGFQSRSAHLVLNSLDACVGLLVAYLVHGRFLRDRRVQDLLLSQGLLLLVIAGLGLGYLAELRADAAPGTLDVWLPLTVRFIGGVLVAVAALAGASHRLEPAGWHRWAGIPTVFVVGVVAVAFWLGTPALPLAIDLGDVPTSAQKPILTGHPLLLASQALSAVAFGLAALLFTRQADASRDELLRWLGPACALGTFARLNYLLFPSLYTDWLYTGDLLRTGFYFLLLVGAMREIRQYWRDVADLAVLHDRRRLARELHDGVIQELTYIRSEAMREGAESPITSACDRALGEARAAVLALGSQGDDPLSVALERAARQLAEQHGVRVHFDLDDGVDAETDHRHALIRILREAVTNAVRHGNATRVTVALRPREADRVLRIEDDGDGFDARSVGQHHPTMSGGYGLVSMRERARSLPGSLKIESAPGSGCVVEVAW